MLKETRDKGKDTPIRLDQFDQAVFEEIVRSRVEASTELEDSFGEMWAKLAESHVGSEDSFTYVVDRTLMRPRDLLMFLQTCVQVALNRSHSRITADDILQAEKAYSLEQLFQTASEVENTHPELAGAMLDFQGRTARLTPDEVAQVLRNAGIHDDIDAAIEMLVWFGFLGVSGQGTGEDAFSHSDSVQFNMPKLMRPIRGGRGSYVVHPAFHRALGIQD